MLKRSIILLVCLYQTLAAPTANHVLTQSDAKVFLERFGYEQASNNDGTLQPAQISSPTPSAESIRSYQRFMGLPETGVLDTATIVEMNKPRCGLPDRPATNSRSRRYAIDGTKWPKLALTYRIDSFTPDLAEAEVTSVIKRAFQVWEAVTPLRFTALSTGAVDISIIFANGNHGDSSPFDGVGGVLAHAYFPTYGDAHFDDAETWTINTSRGTNLFQVAAHEFGHSLGMGHSDVRAALMYPTYNGYQPDFQLDQDDIAGIQALYGAPEISTTTSKSTTTTTTTARTTKKSTEATATTTKTTSSTTATTTSTAAPTTTAAFEGPDACDVSRYDAITTTADGNVYMFAGEYFYQLGSADSHIPLRIRDTWAYVYGAVDAAVTFGDLTLLFQGENFHLFKNTQRHDNYIRSIDYFLPGIARSNLNAAWLHNDDLFVSRGQSYWRYNYGHYWLDVYYPRYLQSEWTGLPRAVDAAINDNAGRIYFLRYNNYYIYDEQQARVVAGPLNIATNFFGCSTNFQAIVDSSVFNQIDKKSDSGTPKRPDMENDIIRPTETPESDKTVVSQFASLISRSGKSGVVASVDDFLSSDSPKLHSSVTILCSILFFVLVRIFH